MDTDSGHTHPPGEPFPSLARYCHPAGTITESSQCHSIIPSGQFQDGGDHIRVSEFNEHEPIATFNCCEVSCLTKINAAWNAMIVDKTFYKSTDDSFGIACREGKSMSRISVYFSKNKAYSMMEAVHCNQPAIRQMVDHLGEWLVLY